MDFAHARCAMVRHQRRRPPLHQCAAACSRCRNFILGFGVDDRLGLTQRRSGHSLCAASSHCRVRSLGCGTQGGALPAVSAAGLVCVRLVHAAARRGALPGRRPFLRAGADGQDHGHLAAGRTAAARLLAAAKIFCGCECAPEILTDVVHGGRRNNHLAAASNRGRSDDVVRTWQGRRANRGDAAELAAEKCHLLLFSVRGQGDLAHAPSGVLSAPGKFSAMVESDRRRSSAPGDQRDRVEIAREALSAEWAGHLRIRESLTLGAFVSLVLPYVYLTHEQIGYWRDSYTLFGHALQVTQNNGIAENNFGSALMEMGQPQKAAPHFEAAVRLIPELASAHYNLGVVLQTQNRAEEAARQYQ